MGRERVSSGEAVAIEFVRACGIWFREEGVLMSVLTFDRGGWFGWSVRWVDSD